ncbi:hypothetical protein GYMLUDRAFT_235977 [Collybiopsis luxurians FD-317 M1]|nr:hypothetical protein GYMLUDRAFT_235977 [Collybiopsis luxurians FD-317 M1]
MSSSLSKTLRFVQSLPKRERVLFSQKPVRTTDVDVQRPALDLLEKKIRRRIDATKSLAHEYVAPYHDPTFEAAEKFDWSFNDADLPVESYDVQRTFSRSAQAQAAQQQQQPAVSSAA